MHIPEPGIHTHDSERYLSEQSKARIIVYGSGSQPGGKLPPRVICDSSVGNVTPPTR